MSSFLNIVRFDSRTLSNFVYEIFVGDYFTSRHIFENLPEKLGDADKFFIHYYMGNTVDNGVSQYADILCELYVVTDNGNPSYQLIGEAETKFNECINNVIENGLKDIDGNPAYSNFDIALTQLRLSRLENGYNIITQQIRVIRDF